ncbi:MerR family transcriptional regulator [Pararhizobium mangrovi]|uniref:MerR family transcriptional regulator n=1 Tax=Pararhizobium mangrovi TaxID=2590452 RepID=A0A506UFN5_9HYPH|nr:MerR family transcriptional regulator [Pararhizobium mangrovi]TPW31904.1 MerR family transcriptional regulator [Pararhizobium mangrovi]
MDKSPEAFRTISEVADELDLPQHVLRFWETRFNQIKPMKRGGGRRYYRPDDVELLRGIRHLLYDQGYTIKGAQKLLRQNGPKFVIAIGAGDVETVEALAAKAAEEKARKSARRSPEEKTKAREPEDDRDDQLVGQAKSPSSRRLFGFGQTSEPPATGGGKMAEDDRALLQEALYDLLECKRILDQARS